MEDSIEADLLLHTIDASDPKIKEKIKVVDDILENINTRVDNDYDKNSLISFIKSGVANE